MALSDLGRKSVRRNALLADLLHRITFIEKAGTGIKRIRDEVRAQGCPEPVFENTGFFTATFFPDPWVRAQMEAQATVEVGARAPDEHGISGPDVEAHEARKYRGSTAEVTAEVRRLLSVLVGDMSRGELQAVLHLRHAENFRVAYLGPALAAGAIERTIPERPRSPKQRYRITTVGREILRGNQEKE